MDDQEPIQLDFETNQMLSMYANGVSVADIGDKFHKGVNAIYSRMKEHPRDYEAAKGELAMMRNAKQRRAGALAIDIQLKFLEDIVQNKHTPDVKEMKNVIKIGKTAERRADLNEGKATEITEHKGTTFKIEMPEGFEGKNIT